VSEVVRSGTKLFLRDASVEMASIPSRASELWGERKLLDEFEIDHPNNSYG
jgi:hypothetical protein